LELPRANSIGGGFTGDASAYLGSKVRNRFDKSGYNASIDGLANGAADIAGQLGVGAGAEIGLGTGTLRNLLSKKKDGRFYTTANVSLGANYYTDFRDVITKDNVRMDVDAAVFYQVTDPKLYAYGMKQPLFALQKLAVTTLRNIIGTLELDEVLSSRDFINSKLRATLDEATDAWGIKITRVEIESIVPPHEIQYAMEAQAKAERNKRALILTAEGEKQATILTAEADKKAKVLAAEAEKQKKILEAEGRLKEKELEALGIKALNENCPNDSVIRLKAIQGMEKVADGNATKIIIPSEMQGLVGLANGITEGVTPSTRPVTK
jgi:regulator of protease activity HflC (stomatin/prohibitin superfamily)